MNFAMRYGEPSIPSVVAKLAKSDCRKLIVVPMFPQYSATTTASALDALFDAWKQHRVIPSMRVVRDFHDDSDYIDSVLLRIRHSIKTAEETGAPPDMFLVSFHGIPNEYILRGDLYQKQSCITGKEIARRMGWRKGQWKLVFQSRLGRQKWLTPYTDLTLKELGRNGCKTVLVVQPGFTADCLETIDEIGHEGREEFREAGGETLIHVPCVNDSPAFIEALGKIVEREAGDWITRGTFPSISSGDIETSLRSMLPERAC